MLRHAKSQSCPFCRDSLKRMNSGELWIYPSKCDITDLPTIAKENLKRLFLYIEKLPLIVPNSMVVSYDLHSWRKVWFSVVSCTEHTSGDFFMWFYLYILFYICHCIYMIWGHVQQQLFLVSSLYCLDFNILFMMPKCGLMLHVQRIFSFFLVVVTLI